MKPDTAFADLVHQIDAPASGPAAAPAGASAMHHSHVQPAPVAWVAVADAPLARALAAGLGQRGWRVGLVTTQVGQVFRALRGGLGVRHEPQLLVSGLRFTDGDAFQLIRTLSEQAQAPALALVSRQQRAVIRAAQALATTHGVRLAGVSELPGDVPHILQRTEEAMQALGTPLPPKRTALPPLDRAQLQALLDSGNVLPFFQPKMRLDTHEVVGFEALMRAMDEQGRLITPDRLIGPLVQHGLLGQATLRVAHQTVEFVGACLIQGLGISASINVSLSLMSDSQFCSALLSLVEASGVDPSWITLEITETEAMADLATVIEQTGRIRMLGFNLSIDDFGTAYSSFFQLSQIPFSELKIERAFVENIHLDPTKRAIVGACAHLGRELGLQVVAEGVETPEELSGVKAAGCSAAQGFLIARPMPPTQAAAWLEALLAQHGIPRVQLPGA
jgi:EAL domain-containing protein (putative c-di-GMP-specific phosphodiesterase class I)